MSFHLSISCLASTPQDTSSVTFSSLEMCLHWFGSDLLWILVTWAGTNGLNSLALFWIHAGAMWLLEKKMILWNCIRDSSIMEQHNLTARTAAFNSKRGMVRDFSVATFDFAATNRVTKVLVLVSHGTYAHVPKALIDASENMELQ